MVKLIREVREVVPKEKYNFYLFRVGRSNPELLKELRKQNIIFELNGRSLYLRIDHPKKFMVDDLVKVSISEEDESKNTYRINRDIFDQVERDIYVSVDHGKVVGVIEEIGEDYFVFRVIKGGEVQEFPNFNLLGFNIQMDLLSELDRKFLEENSPIYCVIPGVHSVSEIRKLRKEFPGVVFLVKVDNKDIVQNFDEFLESEIFLYFSRDSLTEAFPSLLVEKLELDMILKANDSGVGSIVEVNVENPMYKDDVYKYLMAGVDGMVFVGKGNVVTELPRNFERFPVSIPRRYKSIINFVKENHDGQEILLDVSDIKIISYLSKSGVWKRILFLQNEFLDGKIPVLFSNVEIAEDIKEVIPVIYEREDVLSVRIPKGL